MRPATPLICQFIDEHKDTYGVVPICRALAVRGVQIAPRTYWAHRSRAPSKRELWDTTAGLLGDILRFPGFQAVATVRKIGGVYTLQVSPTSQTQIPIQ